MMDFHIELRRTNELLERIANALERAVGPDVSSYEPRQRQASEIVNYGIRTWQREQLMQELKPMGLAPAMEDQILNEALDQINEEG